MENNNLKEQVRKDVKEKIAVSNIRKEFDMKSKNNKKLIYWVSSICAVFVLCFSLLISIDFLNNDSNTEIAKNNGTEDLYGKKENLDIKLNNRFWHFIKLYFFPIYNTSSHHHF